MNSTRWAALTIFLGSILMLFARLGHYALWDDEAITAMTARAVWQTGDTSARVDDHNLLVYRDGLLVRNFKDRYTPPLQFYLFAPFIGLLGDSSFVCRLPIALCGVITVCVLLLWLRRVNPSPFILVGVSGHPAEQCIVLSLLSPMPVLRAGNDVHRAGGVLLLQPHWREWSEDRGWRNKDRGFRHNAIFYPPSSILCSHAKPRLDRGLACALAGLLASQYLNYAGVVACLVVDYLIWGRKNPFTFRHWLILLLPQLIVGCVVLSIWNPLRQMGGAVYHSPTWVLDRLCVLWWNGAT